MRNIIDLVSKAMGEATVEPMTLDSQETLPAQKFGLMLHLQEAQSKKLAKKLVAAKSAKKPVTKRS